MVINEVESFCNKKRLLEDNFSTDNYISKLYAVIIKKK